MNLPVDVQLHILGSLDLYTLHKAVQAIPGVKELFLRYPSGVLQRVTTGMGVQIRNLLLTTHSLICRIQRGDTSLATRINDMTAYLAEHLDMEGPRKIELTKGDAWGALCRLCDIDSEISSLVQEYAQDIYERACQRDNPGAVSAPLMLSTTERYRMARAFYRLKLFSVLYYNCADRFKIDLQPTYYDFFVRLSAFELDELITPYQYLVREQRHIIPAIPHTNCTYAGYKPFRNDDPFNCSRCRGAYTEYDSISGGSATWRSAQPFWHTLSGFLINAEGLWAEPDVCRRTPIKLWDDMPEADEQGAGWLSWSRFRDHHMGVSRETYVNDFRILGYCFWDGERLAEWGDMFGWDWVDQYCPTCQSRCDV
jgi:hypothetical protein